MDISLTWSPSAIQQVVLAVMWQVISPPIYLPNLVVTAIGEKALTSKLISSVVTVSPISMVKLSSPELDATTEALTARITALEKAVKKGITVNYTPTESKPQQPANEEPKQEIKAVAESAPVVQEDKPVAKVPVAKPAPKVEPTPVVKTNAKLEEIYNNAKPYHQWVEIVNNFAAVSSSVAAAFAGSSAYESGNYLLIDINNEMAFELLKNPARKEEIRRVIYETTGKAYSLGPYKKPQQQIEQEDPLANFKKVITESGIEIIEE